MFSRLSPFAKHPQSLVPSTPSLSSRPTSPLDVPELLHHIFSFLNQRALRNVLLVCRKWLYLNQHRHRREVIWDIRWEHSSSFKTLNRLAGAERLVLNQMEPSSNIADLRSILHGIQAAKGYNPFVLLGIAVGTLVKTVTRSHPIKGFGHPLRELVFSSRDFKVEWINSLAFPETLTSLKMDKFWKFHVDITRILVVCPLLESLELYSSYNVTVQGPYTDQGKDALPARLPLRSLVLTNLNAPQSWLEDLLTLTPNLDTLKLIEHKKQYVDHTDRITDIWDWDRFRTHLQSLSLPRKQLFYAEHWHHVYDLVPLEADLTICPKTQDRTFLYYGLTPTVLTFFKEQPVFLTSLEILQPKYTCCVYDGWNLYDKLPYTSRPLHRLLCESPNLRHLKTLKMHYMTDFMDVHRRIPIYPVLSSTDQGQEGWLEDVQEAPPPNNVPGIWICRGLETLHLELHVHDQAIEKGKHHSRILYGYIATVCPQLIDLRIRFPHFCASTGMISWLSKYEPYVLEGGLCLLSKLRHLERLWVWHEIFVCENPSELNWLAKFGRTEEHRARRREIVDGWGSRLREEAMLEADRFEKCAGIAGEILGARAYDEEVVTGLENLGLLQDVVNTVAEMDADEYKILPELFKVACGVHHERNPEKEITALFYSPPVGLTAKLLSWVSTS